MKNLKMSKLAMKSVNIRKIKKLFGKNFQKASISSSEEYHIETLIGNVVLDVMQDRIIILRSSNEATLENYLKNSLISYGFTGKYLTILY